MAKLLISDWEPKCGKRLKMSCRLSMISLERGSLPSMTLFKYCVNSSSRFFSPLSEFSFCITFSDRVPVVLSWIEVFDWNRLLSFVEKQYKRREEQEPIPECLAANAPLQLPRPQTRQSPKANAQTCVSCRWNPIWRFSN